MIDEADTDDGVDTVRLYISPLSSELVPRVLGKTASASDVSLFNLQAFPENTFGYIDLPAASALALQKKLNGAYLGGRKMRVEEARPDKKRKRDAETFTQKKNVHFGKLPPGTVPGVELPDGRNVKRGWTGPIPKLGKLKYNKEARQQHKALVKMRQQLPADFKWPQAGDEQYKRKGKAKIANGKTVEVKEMAKTGKIPSFIRQESGAKAAASFVQGKGWVDEEGNVVETVKEKTRAKAAKDNAPVKKVEPPTTSSKSKLQIRAASISSPSTSSLSSSDVSSSSVSTHETDQSTHESDQSTHESSSVLSSDSDSESSDESDASATGPASSVLPSTETRKRKAAPSTPPLVAPQPVHPLEALFKRPAMPAAASDKRPAPITTSFTFGGEDDEDDAPSSSLPPVPQTPFTRRDMEQRSIRSAAPTPDTAAIGRKFDWRNVGDGADSDGSSEGATAVPEKPAAKEQTEFEKHFYANRGDYDRAWKARKREGRKEQRRTENRRQGGT